MLQNLKNKQSTNRFKSWFFLVATILGIFVFTFVGFLGQISKSIANFESNNLISLVQLLVTFEDKSKIESVFDDIETEVTRINLPINNYLGTTWTPKNLRPLLEELTTNLKPLQKYQFTKDGIISANGNKFTDDLSIFLDKLPSFIAKLDDLNFEIFWYKNLAVLDKRGKAGLEQFDKLGQLLKNIYQNRSNILQVLGHFDTQKILILIQNPGEARPTGGFIGSYIPATTTKGNLSIGQSQSIYWVDGQNLGMAGHPITNYYEVASDNVFPHGIRNMNYDTCIPSSLSLINKYFATSQNGQISQIVVAINPDFVLGFLPDDWNLRIENIEINKQNFMNSIEQLTSPELGASTKNPKEKLSLIASSILTNVGKYNLLSSIYNQFQARNIVIYFDNREIQNFWSYLELAGDQNCYFKNKNVVSAFLINLSGDKRNLILPTNYSIYKQNGRVFVSFAQDSIYKQEIKLQRKLNDIGSNFVGITLPSGAKNPKIESNQSINTIFPMPFYKEKEANYPNAGIDKNTGKLRDKQAYFVPTEFEQINRSSYQIDGGVAYNQLDNSEAIGTLISNSDAVNVTFSFDYDQEFNFFVQPNLYMPTLAFGDGTNQDELIIGNKNRLQAGIKIFR